MQVFEGRKRSNLLYIKQVHRPPPDFKLSKYFVLWGTQFVEIKILQALVHSNALPNDSKGWTKKEEKQE